MKLQKLPVLAIAVFCLILFVAAVQPADAQKRLKPGDKIKVQFLGDWYDAEVTEIIRQGHMLKATFTDKRGRKHEGRLFGNRSIRLVEQPPVVKARKWTSSGGGFSIKATYLGLDGDKVKLKKEDGKEISVPLTSLSQSDNAYVKRIEAQLAKAKASNAPDRSKTAGNSGKSKSGTGFDFDKLRNMDPSELKNFAKDLTNPNLDGVPKISSKVDQPFRAFKDTSPQAEIKADEFDLDLPQLAKFNDLIFDRSGTKAIGVVRMGVGPRAKLGLMIHDMAKGEIVGKAELPAEGATVVCDINSDNSMLLTKSGKFARQSRVDIWKIVDGKIAHHAGWALPGKMKMFRTPVFVAFTADDKVLTISHRGQIVIWETGEVKAIAQMETGKHFSGITQNAYQISRDRKYFYAIINGSMGNPSRLIAIDLENAKCVGSTKLGNNNGSFAVSQAGRVAVIGKGSVKIFDSSMKLVEDFSASVEGYRDHVRWIDERFLAVVKAATIIVIDTKTRVPLWKYNATDIIQMGEMGRPRLVLDSNGSVWIAGGSGINQSLTKFTLPHDAAKSAIPTDPDSMIAVKAGMTISLNIRISGITFEQRDAVTAHLTKEFENKGLKVVPNGGQLVLTASTAKGKTKTTQYEVSGVGGMGGGRTESVTTQETILDMQIADANGVFWRRVGTSGGFAPPVVMVRQGQSVQDAIGGRGSVGTSFFKMKFPKHIIRQPEGGAFGQSKIWQGEMTDGR